MTVTSRPRRMGLAATAFGLAIAVGTPLFTTSASATATQFDPAKVSALTLQIENAIARLGPNVTEAEESAAIQAPILASGDTPAEVEAAIHMAQRALGLSRAARLALASLSSWIGNRVVFRPDNGGLGGGPAIGAPPNAISFGGSNYRTQ